MMNSNCSLYKECAFLTHSYPQSPLQLSAQSRQLEGMHWICFSRCQWWEGQWWEGDIEGDWDWDMREIRKIWELRGLIMFLMSAYSHEARALVHAKESPMLLWWSSHYKKVQEDEQGMAAKLSSLSAPRWAVGTAQTDFQWNIAQGVGPSCLGWTDI